MLEFFFENLHEFFSLEFFLEICTALLYTYQITVSQKVRKNSWYAPCSSESPDPPPTFPPDFPPLPPSSAFSVATTSLAVGWAEATPPGCCWFLDRLSADPDERFRSGPPPSPLPFSPLPFLAWWPWCCLGKDGRKLSSSRDLPGDALVLS